MRPVVTAGYAVCVNFLTEEYTGRRRGHATSLLLSHITAADTVRCFLSLRYTCGNCKRLSLTEWYSCRRCLKNVLTLEDCSVLYS
jgi:hypothetical protein